MDTNPGFRVVVEDIKGLHKQFQIPNQLPSPHGITGGRLRYWLGESPLSSPANEVIVTGQSNGRLYALDVIIPLESIDIVLANQLLSFSENSIKKHFTVKQVGKAVVVFDTRNNEEFTLTSDHNKLIIKVHQKEIGTLKQFENDLRRFALLLEITIRNIYQDDGSPSITLRLQPQLLGLEQESTIKLAGEVNKEALRQLVEIEKPNTSFAEVGGQENAKREIQGLSFALKNPALYLHWGTKPPKGILLVGPSGTGKTLLVRALASETSATLLYIKSSDVSSMWYGASEKNIQAIFDLAREEDGPCIIFIDEIDALTPNRNGAHEATQRVVSTFLVNLNGLEPSTNIIVVAATNRLEAVDPAILQPGRIDRIVDVPLPDQVGRKQILSIHLDKAQQLAGRPLLNGIDLDRIVEQTENMSGADIAEIVRRVLEEKVRLEGLGEPVELVSTDDILKEVSSWERVRVAQRSLGFSPKK